MTHLLTSPYINVPDEMPAVNVRRLRGKNQEDQDRREDVVTVTLGVGQGASQTAVVFHLNDRQFQALRTAFDEAVRAFDTREELAAAGEEEPQP